MVAVNRNQSCTIIYPGTDTTKNQRPQQTDQIRHHSLHGLFSCIHKYIISPAIRTITALYQAFSCDAQRTSTPQLAVCPEATPPTSAGPHPPTIAKRPAKLRYLRTSGSSASPAASDMSPAHRPDPRQSPAPLLLHGVLILHKSLVLPASGLRGPGSTPRLAAWRMVV